MFFLLIAGGGAALPALLGGPSTVAVAAGSTAEALRDAGLDVSTAWRDRETLG